VTGTADSVGIARAQYRALVVEWDEARDRPKEANRLFDAIHALYKQLRGSETGRQAIIGLLSDPVTAVRLSAATHSLAWDPERAEGVLEEIEREDSLHSVTAKWTLQSHRGGKLNLDW
jgi:hypothetical protein